VDSHGFVDLKAKGGIECLLRPIPQSSRFIMTTAQKRSHFNQPSPLEDMHETISSWFLGPRAENVDMVKALFVDVVDSHRQAREDYSEYHNDPVRLA
jgi:hypothetical protein